MKKYEKMTAKQVIDSLEELIDDQCVFDSRYGDVVEVEGLNKWLDELKEECEPRVANIRTAKEVEDSFEKFKVHCDTYCSRACAYKPDRKYPIECYIKWLKEEE